MLALCRSDSGQWTHWRVGRRRLAWMPGSRILRATLEAGELFFVVAAPIAAWWLVEWACALLATLVVWPWRSVSGRWPVVAYPLNVPHRDGTFATWVRGRDRADALARRWASEIRQQGDHFRPTDDAGH